MTTTTTQDPPGGGAGGVGSRGGDETEGVASPGASGPPTGENGAGSPSGHETDSIKVESTATAGGFDPSAPAEMMRAAAIMRGHDCHIIPVGTGKKPVIKWRTGRQDYVMAPASDAQITAWAERSDAHGWALLSSPVTRDVILDIEAPGMAVPEVVAALDSLPDTCRVRSVNGGEHAYLRVTDGGMPTDGRIASRPGADGDPVLLVELRHVGQYAVPHGPGRPRLSDDFRPHEMTRAEYEALVKPLRALDEAAKPEPGWSAPADRGGDQATPSRERAPRDGGEHDGGTASMIFDLMADGVLTPLHVLPDGWEVVGGPDREGRQHFVRPGAGSEQSGNVRDGHFVIHSTAVEGVRHGQAVTAADTLAAMRFDGDLGAALAAVEAAAAALVEDGELLAPGHPLHDWPAEAFAAVHEARTAALGDYFTSMDEKVYEHFGGREGDGSADESEATSTGETPTATATGKIKAYGAHELAPTAPTLWLVRGLLPQGQTAVLFGDEGIGKSLWWVLIVAHLTTGMPDPTLGIPARPPRDVVLIITEDSWSSDVRPRLEVAGADLSRIVVLAEDDDGSGSPEFPRDMQVIEEVATTRDVALVVVDAWMDTIPGKLQIKDPQQARQALGPWRNVAIKTGACCLLVAHSNRTDSATLRDRVGGTAALRQKARVMLYAAKPPGDGPDLYIGADKANGIARGEALHYRLNVMQVRPATDDDPGTCAGLTVVGTTGATMESHYARWRAEAKRQEKPSAEDRARRWLIDYLTDQGGEATAEATKRAARGAFHNPDRLAHLVKEAGGYAGPGAGPGSKWVYRLPEPVSAESPSQSPHVPETAETAETGAKRARKR